MLTMSTHEIVCHVHNPISPDQRTSAKTIDATLERVKQHVGNIIHQWLSIMRTCQPHLVYKCLIANQSTSKLALRRFEQFCETFLKRLVTAYEA